MRAEALRLEGCHVNLGRRLKACQRMPVPLSECLHPLLVLASSRVDRVVAHQATLPVVLLLLAACVHPSRIVAWLVLLLSMALTMSWRQSAEYPACPLKTCQAVPMPQVGSLRVHPSRAVALSRTAVAHLVPELALSQGMPLAARLHPSLMPLLLKMALTRA